MTTSRDRVLAGRPKHLCFVAPFAHGILSGGEQHVAGGAEVQQLLIAKALGERGHKITFIIDDSGQCGAPKHGEISVVGVPFRYFHGRRGKVISDAKALLRTLGQLNPDVVFVKVPNILLVPLAVDRLARRGKLIKLIAHDDDCTFSWAKPLHLTYGAAVRVADSVVFQSHAQLNMAPRFMRSRGTVIRNIAHGVPNAQVHAKTRDVLWVGTFNRHKRAEIAIHIAQQCPELNVTMIAAPGADRAYNEHVASLAKSVPNVELVGFVPYSLVARFYQEAKMLLSSSAAEGFPNTFLQAWQHGAAVVSLTVDPDGVLSRFGVGVPAGTVENLVTTCKRLASNEAERQALCSRGAEYLQSHHSKAMIVQQFETLLQQAP